MFERSTHIAASIITVAGLCHDTGLIASATRASALLPAQLERLIYAIASLLLLSRGLGWISRRQNENDRQRHEARFAARLAAVEARTVLRRSAEAAAELIKAATTPDELRALLNAGVLRVPAYTKGELGYGDDAVMVAKHARIFDRELVLELIQQHAAKELVANSSLPTESVDPLVWHFASSYPSIGIGYSANMARQFGVRPFLKRLVTEHGLTASHPIAQKVFAHAVGDAGVPQELKPGLYSGPIEPCHSREILQVFPDWPADWTVRLAAVREREAARKPEVRQDGTVLGWILTVLILTPWYGLLLIEQVAWETWETLAWPFRQKT